MSETTGKQFELGEEVVILPQEGLDTSLHGFKGIVVDFRRVVVEEKYTDENGFEHYLDNPITKLNVVVRTGLSTHEIPEDGLIPCPESYENPRPNAQTGFQIAGELNRARKVDEALEQHGFGDRVVSDDNVGGFTAMANKGGKL